MGLAKKALADGDDLFARKHYDEAVPQYEFAVKNLPDAPATGPCAAAPSPASARHPCAWAQQLTEGRFEDARSAAKTILNYDPNYGPRGIARAHGGPAIFQSPDRPEIRDKVHEVQRLFVEAKGFYDTARWDLAYKRCDQILDIDHYNIAARHLQEDIEAQRASMPTRHTTKPAHSSSAGHEGMGNGPAQIH